MVLHSLGLEPRTFSPKSSSPKSSTLAIVPPVTLACMHVSQLVHHSPGGDLDGHLHGFGEAVSHVLVNGLNTLDVNVGDDLGTRGTLNKYKHLQL